MCTDPIRTTAISVVIPAVTQRIRVVRREASEFFSAFSVPQAGRQRPPLCCCETQTGQSLWREGAGRPYKSLPAPHTRHCWHQPSRQGTAGRPYKSLQIAAVSSHTKHCRPPVHSTAVRVAALAMPRSGAKPKKPKKRSARAEKKGSSRVEKPSVAAAPLELDDLRAANDVRGRLRHAADAR